MHTKTFIDSTRGISNLEIFHYHLIPTFQLAPNYIEMMNMKLKLIENNVFENLENWDFKLYFGLILSLESYFLNISLMLPIIIDHQPSPTKFDILIYSAI